MIDYKTFRRGRARGKLLDTHRQGMQWMYRGAVQLLLWRIVYYHVYVDPSRIANGADLACYLLGNVALYLRVSGQFHLVIGLLHMFGWRLPDTNRRYFLAASFSDYWRRVNIYWKDFILKVFYYPALFRWKAQGEVRSLVAATAFAFAMTWLLHAYQWFWLRGELLLRAPDAIFWGSLAVLVTVNSLWELRRGRARSLRPVRRSWLQSLGVGARTGATFVAIAILWSLWTADSLPQWLEIWGFADLTTLGYVAGATGAVVACAMAIEAPPRVSSTLPRPVPRRHLLPRGAALGSTALLVLGYGISGPRVSERLTLGLGLVARSLCDTRPNKWDEEYLVRGYYENLMDVGRFNVLAAGAGAPAGWDGLESRGGQVSVRDLRNRALVPGLELESNGRWLSTNAWGMRDGPYATEKPSGSYRIAVLGSSVVMGWGVGDGESFEALVEERLNRELSPQTGLRYELLNFAMNGYSPVAQVEVMRRKEERFHPDAVVIFGHTQDPLFTVHELGMSLRNGVEPPAPLGAVALRARVDAKTPERRADRWLGAHWEEILRWAFGEIVGLARSGHAVPVYVYLPDVVRHEMAPRDHQLLRIARESGFATLSLADAYAAAPWSSLVIAAWDHHPNATAHAMLADALFQAIRSSDPPGLRYLASNAKPEERQER